MAVMLLRYRTTEGSRVALVDDSGYKWLKVVYLDSAGLRVHKVPREHARYMDKVRQAKKIPAIEKVAKRFYRYGRQVGMTKAAKSFLTQVMRP